jgi:hypothetical protein
VQVDQLLKMIGTDRDSAMLRLTLSRVLAAQGDTVQARAHLEATMLPALPRPGVGVSSRPVKTATSRPRRK